MSDVSPSFQIAKTAFEFLVGAGFSLVKERDSGDDTRSGWELTYSSTQRVTVWIAYSDWQLDVDFYRGPERVSYFDIDRELYARRSGYHGNMFTPDKLRDPIETVARDIRLHYATILSGAPDAWEQAIRRTRDRPKPRLP